MAKNKYIDATLRFHDKFTGAMGKAVTKMQAHQKTLKASGAQIDKIGKSYTKAGKTLTAGVTAPIAGLAVTAVKTAADFESAMSKVAASMGTTPDKIKDIEDMALEMGRKTAFSNAEAAEGFNILAQAGLKSTEQIAAIKPVLDLASAGSIDMANSAKYVTGAVMGFRDEMQNADYYANLIAKGATLAKTDVDALGAAFSGGASSAKSYGQTAEGTATALLRFAQANETGTQAATALNRICADLMTPTEGAAKALKKLGVSAYDSSGKARDINNVVDDLSDSLKGMTDKQKNAYLSTILSTKGLKAYNQMTASSKKKVEEFRKGLATASDGQGAAAQQAETMLDNFNGQLVKLKSAVEGIMTTIGEKLMPYVKKITEKFQDWADKISKLDDKQVDMIVKIAGVAAAIGPVLIVIGKVISTVGKVKKALGGLRKASVLMNLKVMAVIAVVAGLVAIGYLVYKNWDKIKEFFIETGKKISESFNRMKDRVSESIQRTKDRFAEFKDKIKESFENIKNRISESVQNIKDRFREFVTSSINNGGIIGAVFQNIKNIVGGVKQVFSGIIQFVKGIFTKDWATAWEGVKNVFKGIFSTLGAVLKAPLNGVIGLVNSAIGAINKVHVTIPDWVPGIGGQTFGGNIPKIPYLAKGTSYFKGGAAVINEKGGEIVDLPRGTRVIPHDKSVKEAYKTGQRKGGRVVKIEKIADTIVIREDADIDKIAEAIARKLEETADNVA